MLIPHEIVKREWSLEKLSDRALLKIVSDAIYCNLESRSYKKTISIKDKDIAQVNKTLATLDTIWTSTI